MSLPNDPDDAPTSLSFTVTVNAQARTLPAASTLADLMALIGETSTATAPATATAVNGEFVPISRRAARTLREGDQVTCFQLIVGG
ncbi:MAG: MoaD/ThiS family protein [Bacteriovorax sp.]|nr:MoaD/ThiS family protein [Rhizobacter sp.]